MSKPINIVERVTKQVRDSTGTLAILHEIDFTLAAQAPVAIVGGLRIRAIPCSSA